MFFSVSISYNYQIRKPYEDSFSFIKLAASQRVGDDGARVGDDGAWEIEIIMRPNYPREEAMARDVVKYMNPTYEQIKKQELNNPPTMGQSKRLQVDHDSGQDENKKWRPCSECSRCKKAPFGLM
uniref:Uncharacterized protein n=1 Tax=Cannabis sativa TaxID=3483 RepID=A0A803PK48_CANSA